MTYLSTLTDSVVEVTALGKFHDEKDVRMGVDDLVETDDVRVLQLLHDLDLQLHFLLQS